MDRGKLCGYKEIEVLDEQEHRRQLATLADNGRTVVGRSSTGIGYIPADGDWCDKSNLKPADVEGREIKPVESSYSAPTRLFDTAMVDVYLDDDIHLVYQLQSDDHLTELMGGLQRSTIFTFPYSYRRGLEANVGLMLMADDEHIFLAVGNLTKTDFIGLQQLAAAIDEEEEVDETDFMSFDML